MICSSRSSSGIQCFGGMVCDQMTGRCIDGGPVCLSDGDCNAPQTVCNLATGQCDPGCGTAGCTAPRMCNHITGHCVDSTTCTEDMLEDNDTRSTASMLSGLNTNAQLCSGDDDWFSVSLGLGDALTVDATFQHGEGNIDLELHDPSGAQVGTARSTNDDETISFTAASAGTHTIRATLAADTGPQPGNAYVIRASVSPAGCVDDLLEENDEAGAAALVLPGMYTGLTVCPGDKDFFRFFMNTGQVITVNLRFPHAEGDIDARLLNFVGLPLAAGVSLDDDETMTYTATRFGTVTIEVDLFAETPDFALTSVAAIAEVPAHC